MGTDEGTENGWEELGRGKRKISGKIIKVKRPHGKHVNLILFSSKSSKIYMKPNMSCFDISIKTMPNSSRQVVL